MRGKGHGFRPHHVDELLPQWRRFRCIQAIDIAQNAAGDVGAEAAFVKEDAMPHKVAAGRESAHRGRSGKPVTNGGRGGHGTGAGQCRP